MASDLIRSGVQCLTVLYPVRRSLFTDVQNLLHHVPTPILIVQGKNRVSFSVTRGRAQPEVARESDIRALGHTGSEDTPDSAHSGPERNAADENPSFPFPAIDARQREQKDITLR